jgi:hypothetical protein
VKCAECKRELEVGDHYIKFTQTEWAEREGKEPLDGFDDIFAQIMGSGYGDYIVMCEDCTVEDPNGLKLDTVYGDESAR